MEGELPRPHLCKVSGTEPHSNLVCAHLYVCVHVCGVRGGRGGESPGVTLLEDERAGHPALCSCPLNLPAALKQPLVKPTFTPPATLGKPAALPVSNNWGHVFAPRTVLSSFPNSSLQPAHSRTSEVVLALIAQMGACGPAAACFACGGWGAGGAAGAGGHSAVGTGLERCLAGPLHSLPRYLEPVPQTPMRWSPCLLSLKLKAREDQARAGHPI